MSQPDFVFRGHQSAVNCVHFMCDSRFLVSGDQDGKLIIWNMLLKRQLTSITTAHSGAILAISSTETTIITQGRDNKLCLWLLEAQEFSGTLKLQCTLDIESMNFCKFSSASKWIVGLVAGDTANAFIYDVEQDKRLTFSIERNSFTRMGNRQDTPMCLLLSCTDKLELLVGYESNTLQGIELFVQEDTVDSCIKYTVDLPHKEPLMSIDMDIQKQLIYTCAADNNVSCLAAESGNGKVIRTAQLSHSGSSHIRCFASANVVAVAGWDYALHLFTCDLNPIQDVCFHRAALTCVDMSSNCKQPLPGIDNELAQQRWMSQPQWIAIASRDSRISLWNTNRINQAHDSVGA
ncbi:Astra associated protein 1 Asa1 [Coemansia sp. RSA 990]|nr:WD40-repeat-containing domain protein [Coemansia mojavensis]KAJ1743025.1 Astra associated protein 1 Asa1 [Coemansia sp. RSA 1086]KAJ1751167.1 Astra associated protein 1 Asa1 [Coemansia sp. RSA 1821]KAJ1871816.1 Astra associated protein 1 Asa1 [Coemansia sp. RSA 990]KAJ2676284.1 Astra associated protein 1 Asa1 [Coemansia sp. RSA 1085]